MAFNFNWSPLTADAGFYDRARDLLTTALNKSPKPPIIVDDILVTEFNLGSVPPDLEILEIGDLAEDRFRGIFKMCYSGDAFLTLKTRVQVRFGYFSLRQPHTPTSSEERVSNAPCFSLCFPFPFTLPQARIRCRAGIYGKLQLLPPLPVFSASGNQKSLETTEILGALIHHLA
jgi:hypothetical protein